MKESWQKLVRSSSWIIDMLGKLASQNSMHRPVSRKNLIPKENAYHCNYPGQMTDLFLMIIVILVVLFSFIHKQYSTGYAQKSIYSGNVQKRWVNRDIFHAPAMITWYQVNKSKCC